MAEPSYWEPVPVGGVWDPVTNNDPATGDWIELGDLEEIGGGDSIARDDGVKTLVGIVPTAKRYDFERKAVQVAWADTASPWLMHRINPLPHPQDWRYRCVTADFVRWNPQPSNKAAEGQPPVYDAWEPAPYLDIVPDGPDGNPAARLPTLNRYSRVKATLRFRMPNYPILEDSEMFDTSGGGSPVPLPEVFRHTSFFDTCDPLLDVLLTGNEAFLEWADVPSPLTSGPTQNTDVVAQVPDYIQRANFVAVWHHVPEEFIIAPGPNYIPKKIMDGIGCVNSATWYGFPPGTLKLEAPRFKKSVQAAVRVIPNEYKLPFCYDIMLPFSWVDPSPAPVVGTPSKRGWNMVPYSNTGKWFSVKRKNGGGPYFQTYDFNKIFEHVSA